MIAKPKGKMSPRDIAENRGVSVETVLAWIHSQELKATNQARHIDGKKPRWIVEFSDLLDFLERRSSRPVAKAGRRRKQMAAEGVTKFF
jgi:hypothetical protein